MVLADQKLCDWLRPLLTKRALEKWTLINKEDYYEVVISQEISAINHGLLEKQFVSIDKVSAKQFTGFYYHSGESKNPYLVRSVYGYGGTGQYALYRRGNDLLVEHSSLGSEASYNKSALVVNLDFKPEQVFVICSIGR